MAKLVDNGRYSPLVPEVRARGEQICRRPAGPLLRDRPSRLGYDRARILLGQYADGLELHQLRHSSATHVQTRARAGRDRSSPHNARWSDSPGSW